MKEIGSIISLNGTPSSSEFWFVVTTEEPIKKGQIVQVNLGDSTLVGRIDEIVKYNRYYSSPEAVSEYERNGKSMTDHFPIERWEYLIAKVKPLGVYEGNQQKRVTIPPSPGSKVFLADDNLIKLFFGFDDKGLDIGSLEFHNVEVKLNLTRLFQKHLSILAMSGSGKSYLASVLIEEILDRPKELGAPAVIVIDPHGEYKIFSESKKYSFKTKVWNKNNLQIATYKLGANFLHELVPQMSAQQRRDIKPIIAELSKTKKMYNLDDLITAVEISKIKSNIKQALISWLEELKSTHLFSNVESPTLQELVRPGELSIIDLSDFVHLREKQIVVTYIARRLFEARRKKIIPPFILFVEEAHQFAPEKEERSRAISKSVIEQIAREGRKFFASLVLISQRPVKLSTTALSQCNTQIIMRVTNPYDLQHIEESSEGITREVIKTIPGLKVGEAFVVGEAVNFPVLFRVRKRKVDVKSSEKTFEDELREWTSKENNSEIEDFLFS